jgi:hypothetical protein
MMSMAIGMVKENISNCGTRTLVRRLRATRTRRWSSGIAGRGRARVLEVVVAADVVAVVMPLLRSG